MSKAMLLLLGGTLFLSLLLAYVLAAVALGLSALPSGGRRAPEPAPRATRPAADAAQTYPT